jgi:metal-responsive CopG/Arc/MetJ family transcriptional regulator
MTGGTSVRTTVELTEKQRLGLLNLAAKRGIKGFSTLVQEAIEQFLNQESYKNKHIENALAMKGVFSDKEADELSERTKNIRETWR